MAISLQDQLLKAGLASKKQANKAKADKRKKKSKTAAPDNALQIQQQQTAKRDKDRQLNLDREQQKADKASISQARQIVESNRVTIPRGSDITHQFSHLKFVKSIYVDKQLQSQLFCGLLTVVFMDDKYWLIPTDQAHRLNALQSDWVVELPKKELKDDDDPYADYAIPDDLMW
ncbi:MAG: hypothetical protein OFPII_01000 [Osedax symbiont Rs1]|nr:MAG: hypothetical protein OFPII_01000 [Osedax symbiont Rs1]